MNETHKIMKRILPFLFLSVFLTVLTGCSKKFDLTEEQIEKNILVIKEEGSLQVAITDSFDKDYYDFEEFEEYINEEISDYNNEFSDDPISLQVLHQNLNDDKIVVIMSYSDMDHYAEFNGIQGFLTDGGTALQENNPLPETFLDKKGNEVERAEALKKDENKVFAIAEDIEIKVEGKILYYYNGDYVDSQTLKSDEEEMTYLIFEY